MSILHYEGYKVSGDEDMGFGYTVKFPEGYHWKPEAGLYLIRYCEFRIKINGQPYETRRDFQKYLYECRPVNPSMYGYETLPPINDYAILDKLTGMHGYYDLYCRYNNTLNATIRRNPTNNKIILDFEFELIFDRSPSFWRELLLYQGDSEMLASAPTPVFDITLWTYQAAPTPPERPPNKIRLVQRDKIRDFYGRNRGEWVFTKYDN